ncbi:hypothetical protein VTK56DRAFT_7962 [Thermocarpiscus australiensis]
MELRDRVIGIRVGLASRRLDDGRSAARMVRQPFCQKDAILCQSSWSASIPREWGRQRSHVAELCERLTTPLRGPASTQSQTSDAAVLSYDPARVGIGTFYFPTIFNMLAEEF